RVRYSGSPKKQPEEQELAPFDGNLSHPHAGGARRTRCHGFAGRLEAKQSSDSTEQHRVHGRMSEERRDYAGRRGGICQETSPSPEEEYRLGGANSGRPLDERDRRLETDAWRRLG